MITYDRKAAEEIERSYRTPEIIRQRLQTLGALALRAGEKVFDAGCGTGLLLQLIAGQVGKEGSAVGLDFSDDMLEFARGRCGDLDQVSLHQGSVTELPFDSESFDAASCIQTLLYVDEVESALAELYRVLKPGGRLAVLETDWRGVVINSPDIAFTRRIIDAWDSAVPSPNLPVKLIPLLKRSGFSSIKVEAIPILNTSYSETVFSAGMLEYFARYAVKQKVISQLESEQWLAQIHALAAEDAYFFSVNRFLFSAIK